MCCVCIANGTVNISNILPNEKEHSKKNMIVKLYGEHVCGGWMSFD